MGEQISELERTAPLEDAFREWWAHNAASMEMGGTGDVYDLLLSLMAASKNCNAPKPAKRTSGEGRSRVGKAKS